MKSKFVAQSVSALSVAAFQSIYQTLRFRFHGMENIREANDKYGGYIYCCWHQNVLSSTLSQTGRPYVVMASQSRSADPIDAVCRSFGHKVVRGSSSVGGRDKGGKDAKDEMIAILKSGISGAVAVDGPKGPLRQVKPGIVDMAKQTGYPIIPFAGIPTRYWTLDTWDQFRVPKPFSKVNVYYGTPIVVDKNIAADEFAEIMQAAGQATTALEAS